MENFIQELGMIAAREPTTCVLVFRGDCPADAVVFDDHGPESRALEEVAKCNKFLHHPTGLDALFQGDGHFDYMSAKAAVEWFKDGETPWQYESLNEYGGYARIGRAPTAAIIAYKRRIDAM